MRVQEYYRPQPMAANSSYIAKGTHIAGFLATVSGTITITDANGTVVVNALPIPVGPTSIPILSSTPDGFVVQLGGGATGTLLV